VKKLLLFLCIASFLSSFSQTEDAWVYLKDKPNSATFLQNPLQMLSQRSLDRRTIQNILLDLKDVPIDVTYYIQLKNDTNFTVLGKSKWLNAIHIQGTKMNISSLLNTYSFIESIDFADKSLNSNVKKKSLNGISNNKGKKKIASHKNKFRETKTDFNYGNAENQIKMLKGDFLHQQNFTGEGMQIAIIDAGFPNVNTLSAFQRIRDNNQILGGYNFADRNTDFYTRNNHGTHVLSTIAGYLENQFIGTAPDAKFYLFITEIAETETVLEETLWVEAAERADSLGVNVINTSLGYTTYDNSNYNHTYSEMDGKTTYITRGAEIAASRGMILVNAAGNEGNDPWKYIGAPADAVSVFSIGAVNSSENIASFSSFGPTADSRIKPDVLAQGLGSAIIQYSTGSVSTSNGTSFSSPIMAGVVACFWQAFPNKTNFEIMDLIRNSANRFNTPTDQYGYGIPDFEAAYNQVLKLNDFKNSSIKIFPNPIKDTFSIYVGAYALESLSIKLYNILGQLVFEKSKLTSKTVDITNLKNGIYVLKITYKNQQKTVKLIKK